MTKIVNPVFPSTLLSNL